MLSEAERIENSNSQLAEILKGYTQMMARAQSDLSTLQEIERQTQHLQKKKSEHDAAIIDQESWIANIRKRMAQLEDGPMWLNPLERQIKELQRRTCLLRKTTIAHGKRLNAIDQEGDGTNA